MSTEQVGVESTPDLTVPAPCSTAAPAAVERDPASVVSDELAAVAAPVLERLAAQHGETAARLHALAFLARHFKDEGEPDDAPRVAELSSQLVGLRGELAEVRGALELARTQVERAEGEAYLRQLRRDAALAHAPIPEADLERVSGLLSRRDLAMARALGAALLGRSQAEGQAAYRAGQRVRLGESTGSAKGSTATQARLLRHAGWEVELSKDGAEIVRAEPAGDGP